MDSNERDQTAVSKVTVLESNSADDALLPPWLFRHDDLIKALASAPLMEKKKLTNTLNHIHFKGEHIYVLLKHPLYEEGVLVKVNPEPCMGDELTCRWDRTYADYNLERYHFQYLIIASNQSVIISPVEVLLADSNGLTLKLPEQSHLVTGRQAPRFACFDVKAELWQNGFQAGGELVDFNPHAFRIKVEPAPPSSFHWFNSEVPSTIRLSNGKDVYYSGNCNCIHQKQNGRSREIVLVPLHDQIQRFKTKEIRNPRRQPLPPFSAVFEHPFFKKKVQRDIFDISTSGFSICGGADEEVLMPGLIIPAMDITYAGILKMRCKSQVIYRKNEEENVRFGMAILDMSLTDYNNLAQMLNHIPGSEAGMANETDLDELWEFFFDTDFIYPKKYKYIQSFKNDFRETYRKLYEESPEIARHFTYQDNGRIYGHISILRAYERTWMVHHHAARPIGGRHMGLVVLKQLIYYLNDLRRLPSANMEYVITYFRPGNKFPERIFGGVAKELANPQQCSLDLFTYINYPTVTRSGQLPRGWSVRECSSSDLWEFERFYKHRSGGLFWSILTSERRPNAESLGEVYAGSGFIRRWKTFALTCTGDLKAFIVAEESDEGINLSDLLNGFKVFVMDPQLSPDILFAAVSETAKNRSAESVPLLIYPDDYAHKKDIGYEKKQYFLWILDIQYGNEYLAYLGQKFRIRFV